MRFCPTCRTQYTDDTLRFCLQDGSMLVTPHEAETPTAAFDEAPTIVRPGDRKLPRTTQPDLNVIRPKRRRSIAIPLILASIVLLLLFTGAAIGIWWYQHNRIETANKNSTNNSISNSKQSPGNVSGYSPSPNTNTPAKMPTPPPFPSASPAVFDQELIRSEVSKSVDDWNSAAQSRDLNSYMSNYADTVDYYRKGGVSRATVRGDKARAFGMYNSMRISLSDMNVSLGENGTQATAEFDKEWDFRGSRSSSGKVRSQLRFKNENGRWLITGERDIRVYYID